MTNPSIGELASRVLDFPAGCGPLRVVLIDGPAGSGKTTLAARLAAALGAQVLHADDMYEGWDGLPVLRDVLVGRVLEPLAAGQKAGFERWDWVASARAERIAVPPHEPWSSRASASPNATRAPTRASSSTSTHRGRSALPGASNVTARR